MTAAVIPFPIARRLDLVQSVARRMLELPPDRAERHFEFSLERQAKVMRRRGIAQAAINQELTTFAAAVRALVWENVFFPQEGGR